MPVASYSAPAYDLVMVHGFGSDNGTWPNAFLARLVGTWGAGNVYVIYLNRVEGLWGYHRYVWNTRGLNNAKKTNSWYISGDNEEHSGVIYSGRKYGNPNNGLGMFDDPSKDAGEDSIEDQACYMDEHINILQSSYNLSDHFYIISHSMGGLVSRRYIKEYSGGKVISLVTLGTPHSGSAAVEEFYFKAFSALIGAEDARLDGDPCYFSDVECATSRTKPSAGQFFNDLYGVNDQLGLCSNCGGGIFSIFGTLSYEQCSDQEFPLNATCEYLYNYYGLDDGVNDGTVPGFSALSGDFDQVYNFQGYNHSDLKTEIQAAEKAIELLGL
jgi:triacylglycerol lipase